MGLTIFYAQPIIREHVYKAIRGKILVLGRQSMYFNIEQAYRLMTEAGHVPSEASYKNALTDQSTLLGGEGGERVNYSSIEDKSFFEMLGIHDLYFLDHSEYEGADIVLDINTPIPKKYYEEFDFIIDGGCFDNIFNPSQAISNVNRMLKPGGRFITFNVLSYTWSPYIILPYQWYMDYFALNQYIDCKTYMSVNFSNGTVGTYLPNFDFIIKNKSMPVWGLSGEYLHLIYMIAEKGNQTLDLAPSQDLYRSEKQWDSILSSLETMANSNRPHIVHSVGTPPVRTYHLNEFFYIDNKGEQQNTIHDFDESHFKVVVDRLINTYHKSFGYITLFGSKTDFINLCNFSEIIPLISNDRVQLVSMSHAGEELSFNNTVFSIQKMILAPNKENLCSKIVLSCMPDHKDRAYIYSFLSDLGAKQVIDLYSDEDSAQEYWSLSTHNPSSVGMGQTYIKGLP